MRHINKSSPLPEALNDRVPIILLLPGEGEHTAPHKGCLVPSTRAHRSFPCLFHCSLSEPMFPFLSPSIPPTLFVYIIVCNPRFIPIVIFVLEGAELKGAH